MKLLVCTTTLLCALRVPAAAQQHDWAVMRSMNSTNFASHNIVGGGCDPDVASNHTTARQCQAACDGEGECDMWTFVAKPKTGVGPLCCLKTCTVGGVRQCEPPEREDGCVSGVKNVTAYLAVPAPAPCTGTNCFQFTVDWNSGNSSTSFPTLGRFGIRKVEAFVYPKDGKTYAYADIVNYTCPTWSARNTSSCLPGEWYYPDSYSTEVGVFSSADGMTGWQYHGIVVGRGKPGDWDGGGIASPGAASAADGTVIVGYAAENSPSGGINRGIGIATADHPLGPFTKCATPIASPKTICGGTGRCDDVIMQTRPDGVHLYHSVKGSNIKPGSGIRHRMSSDAGKTWSESKLVLSSKMQPPTNPAETIAGKFFPSLFGPDEGGMVLITDGGHLGPTLHAYVSKTSGDMTTFVAAEGPGLGPTMHPQVGSAKEGRWANFQIAFFPNIDGSVPRVGYTLWQGNPIKSRRSPAFGMTMVVYDLNGNATS
jgi:hypothetical protein